MAGGQAQAAAEFGAGAALPSAVERPIGRFLVGDRIAAGGMASVHAARCRDANDPLAGRSLAIKILHAHLGDDDEFIRMFRDEGRVAMLLEHPNIVRVHTVGEENGEHYLVMDRIDGRNLAKVLESFLGARKPVPRAATVAVLRAVLTALDHVHTLPGRNGKSMGLVHRDVSPHNILIASDERVLLADFGIARGDHRSDRTRTGTVKGKLHYMSPEQARGGRVDARADLYSLAVVAYEMLTSKPLLGPDGTAALQARVASGQIALDEAAVGKLPEDLLAWLTRTLEPERDARYSDARTMLEALESTRVAAASRFKPGTLMRMLDVAADAGAAPKPQMLFASRDLSTPRKPQDALPSGLLLTPQRPISGVFVGAGAAGRSGAAEALGEVSGVRRRSRELAGGPSGSLSANNPIRIAEAEERRANSRLRRDAAVADGSQRPGGRGAGSDAELDRGDRGRGGEAARRAEAISLRAAGAQEVPERKAAPTPKPPGAAPREGADDGAQWPAWRERSDAFATFVAWSCISGLFVGVLLELWDARPVLPKVRRAAMEAARDAVFAAIWDDEANEALAAGAGFADTPRASAWPASAAADEGNAAVGAGRARAAPTTPAGPSVSTTRLASGGGAASKPTRPASVAQAPRKVRNDQFLPRSAPLPEGLVPMAKSKAAPTAAAPTPAAQAPSGPKPASERAVPKLLPRAPAAPAPSASNSPRRPAVAAAPAAAQPPSRLATAPLVPRAVGPMVPREARRQAPLAPLPRSLALAKPDKR